MSTGLLIASIIYASAVRRCFVRGIVEKFGVRSRNGFFRTLRPHSGRFHSTQRPESPLGDALVGVPHIVARQVDVIQPSGATCGSSYPSISRCCRKAAIDRSKYTVFYSVSNERYFSLQISHDWRCCY